MTTTFPDTAARTAASNSLADQLEVNSSDDRVYFHELRSAGKMTPVT